ncbi:hypothetical protein [Saccharothrix sp. HUAS TT1]|uniref:hypothetical protein n=1 Tax=unclassified Saccharothrix TaxID=2593673 RepID=UPI00345BFD6D
MPSVEIGAAQWGYTDARTPWTGRLNPAGDVPVGTTVAGDGFHRTRSYFTFDLTRFGGGERILSATLAGRQTHANDCARHAVEVWETGPFTERSSWRNAPEELTRLASAGGAECVEDVAFDVAGAVAKAVANGDDRLTLELRVPARVEWDKRYGRRYAADFELRIGYNTPPKAPTFVWTNDWREACSTTAPGDYLRIRYSDLGARIPEDPDGPRDALRARLAVWPVDDPATRYERVSDFYNGSASFSLASGGIVVEDERTYAYTFRAEDGTDVSPTSETCYFTMDMVAPDKAPTTSSVRYPAWSGPQGDVGVPGDFTFGANGVDDVVGFWWGRYSAYENYVAADRPGGSATVTWTPTNSGNQSLYVVSVDKAGSTSPSTYHYFEVRESRPRVSSTTYPDYYAGGGIGVPGEFTFTPTLPNTVEHVYRFDDEEERSVAGSTGKVVFTPTRGGEHQLTVRGKDSSGALGAARVYRFTVATAPKVVFDSGNIVGREAGARFEPGMPGVVEYEYWWNDDDSEHRTVAAAADGTASIRWVPSLDLHDFTLKARAKTADGVLSAIGEGRAHVDMATPTITRTGGGLRPGDPASFTVSSRMPEVTEYRWEVAGTEDAGTVAAGPDGTGAFSWTPPDDGEHTITVHARNATGARSDGNWASLVVYSSPTVTSVDYPEWSWAGGVGVAGEFTFTPNANTPDVVEYVYTYHDGWDEGPEQVVAAGPDGSATVTITPTRAFYNYVHVRARSADGTLSGRRGYTMIVND